MLVNSKALLKADSTIADGEKKDCVVYATATAFDLPYDQAHSIVADKFGRENNKGTNTAKLTQGLSNMIEGQESINGKTVSQVVDLSKSYKVHGTIFLRKPRVYSFAKQYPQGTYLILTRSHALTIKDGIVYDNKSKGSEKALINQAYKIG